jgi:hypothetical protein
MSTLLQLGSRPREGLNAERPGSYAPAIRLKRSRVDRREFVEGDVFITGYGQIEGAKLVFYPSTGVFDQDLSSFRFGFEQVQESLIFGGQEKQSGEDGITISLTGGILAETWSRPTLFFDAVKGDLPIIATEMKQMRAPISFRLGVGDKARPGEYQQQFVKSVSNQETRRELLWGAHAPPRAGFGASPKQACAFARYRRESSQWRGAIASTRGRVRSPENRWK